MSRWAKQLVLGAVLLAGSSLTPAGAADSDAEAVVLAERVLERMGGREAWDGTRYLHWRFHSGRLLDWDKWTGNVRVEGDDWLVLMNVHTKEGRAWDGDREITEADSLAKALETGYACWVNDSYWLVMPYKMLDPGVTLTYGGEDALPDGRAADRITLTFDEGVGLTPRNKYDVWIARDSGLVEQWAYYRDVDDAEPRFTGPWSGWKRFGTILLATDRGRGRDWEIAAPESLPPSLFESP